MHFPLRIPLLMVAASFFMAPVTTAQQPPSSPCPTMTGQYVSILHQKFMIVDWSVSVGSPFSSIFDDGIIRASGLVEMSKIGRNCVMHLSATAAIEVPSLTVTINDINSYVASSVRVPCSAFPCIPPPQPQWNVISGTCVAISGTSQQVQSIDSFNDCQAQAFFDAFDGFQAFTNGNLPFPEVFAIQESCCIGAVTPDIRTLQSGTARNDVFLTLPAAANPLTIDTTTLPDGTAGQTYSEQLKASGGSPPYSWNVQPVGNPPVSPLDASHLTLDPATGVISSPRIFGGNNTFTVQVTDSAGTPATQQLSINTECGFGKNDARFTKLTSGFAQYLGANHTPLASTLPNLFGFP